MSGGGASSGCKGDLMTTKKGKIQKPCRDAQSCRKGSKTRLWCPTQDASHPGRPVPTDVTLQVSCKVITHQGQGKGAPEQTQSEAGTEKKKAGFDKDRDGDRKPPDHIWGPGLFFPPVTLFLGAWWERRKLAWAGVEREGGEGEGLPPRPPARRSQLLRCRLQGQGEPEDASTHIQKKEEQAGGSRKAQASRRPAAGYVPAQGSGHDSGNCCLYNKLGAWARKSDEANNGRGRNPRLPAGRPVVFQPTTPPIFPLLDLSVWRCGGHIRGNEPESIRMEGKEGGVMDVGWGPELKAHVLPHVPSICLGAWLPAHSGKHVVTRGAAEKKNRRQKKRREIEIRQEPAGPLAAVSDRRYGWSKRAAWKREERTGRQASYFRHFHTMLEIITSDNQRQSRTFEEPIRRGDWTDSGQRAAAGQEGLATHPVLDRARVRARVRAKAEGMESERRAGSAQQHQKAGDSQQNDKTDVPRFQRGTGEDGVPGVRNEAGAVAGRIETASHQSIGEGFEERDREEEGERVRKERGPSSPTQRRGAGCQKRANGRLDQTGLESMDRPLGFGIASICPGGRRRGGSGRTGRKGASKQQAGTTSEIDISRDGRLPSPNPTIQASFIAMWGNVQLLASIPGTQPAGRMPQFHPESDRSVRAGFAEKSEMRSIRDELNLPVPCSNIHAHTPTDTPAAVILKAQTTGFLLCLPRRQMAESSPITQAKLGLDCCLRRPGWNQPSSFSLRAATGTVASGSNGVETLFDKTSPPGHGFGFDFWSQEATTESCGLV
ncbi:hypothetical protein GGTG_11478 [Gaeumannomyces tritici R3-111a-1]|uniref:Uncharacterized protein n=1 Tax=Gaeumannomyces tritici (strain R3-111a-1) TaxID=644352 RepID=J3PDB0_GAET3|nr:hypothetical protein GGTG_11478 [Gaeumannomyces tritici R3-111a-1]EJT70455.1 hypothetical protein GGTG_11478 [Gaeumannomyces tritici R3-111a-1]